MKDMFYIEVGDRESAGRSSREPKTAWKRVSVNNIFGRN